jgi:hypothetical protein
VFNANYNEGEADMEEKKKKVDTKKRERERDVQRTLVCDANKSSRHSPLSKPQWLYTVPISMYLEFLFGL